MHARGAVDSLDRYCRRTWDLLFRAASDPWGIGSYNVCARQTGQSRCLRAARKVRTPQGRITVNDRPVMCWRKLATSLRTRATETSLHWGCAFGCTLSRCCRDAEFASQIRQCRVKRGNLYPEQHQIGMRVTLCHDGRLAQVCG